jgi:hypothetical protein
MDLQNIKLHALEQKHDLERLADLYLNFQRYIESLKQLVGSAESNANFFVAHEEMRLCFADHEYRFYEWHEGEQLVNSSIYSLIFEPVRFQNNPLEFRDTLVLATKKFEYLIRRKERELRELDDKIRLVVGEKEAHSLTGVEKQPVGTSEVETVRRTDEIAEVGLKWGGRIFTFTSWLLKVLN